MMNGYESFREIPKISKIEKKDVWTIRLLIASGLIIMGFFIWWFATPGHIGYAPIYWLLTVALIFKLVKMLHEWYHYWDLSIPTPPKAYKQYTVDVLTTACPGEPKDMIIRTLHAMKAIRYPHTNYLCDEGDDPELKKVCEDLGVIHVTRVEKINAKAGNINNALKQATGEICVVLDPDHVPVPEFLDRTLPYFEDKQIGFVQCVQGYYNQSESIIARGAAEQTYHFYGPMMMCMNTYGTVQAIGANCTFRREALDSIGGHAAGLSEDMHTAMQIHAKGWKSLYIPEMLTRGLVPATLSAYYKQQLKWSRGTFELLFQTYPKLFKNFTFRQKLHYFTIPLYFLFGLINFMDMLVPLIALAFAQVPWEVDIQAFGMFFLPLCGLSLLIRLYAQRWLLEKHERGFHLAGGVLRTATWWIFLIGFIYSIFNIKVPYIPTPKEDEHQNYWKLSIPNLCISLICGAGIIYGLQLDWSPYSMAMAFYALINTAMLAFIVLMSQQKFLDSLEKKVKTISILSHINNSINNLSIKVQHAFYGLLRNGPVALLIGSALLFLSYNSIESSDIHQSTYNQKDFGGFYTGIYSGEKVNTKKIDIYSSVLNNRFEIISINETWFSNDIDSKLVPLKNRDALALINWETSIVNDSVWKKISSGGCNAYLDKFASSLRKHKLPVYINFFPAFDTRTSSVNAPREFIKAWQYTYTYLNDLGISNVTWVWNPQYNNSAAYYPGSQFVDWIGVSALNYASSPKANNSYTFAQIYQPFRDSYSPFLKPVVITELGAKQTIDQQQWYQGAFSAIKNKFHEIHAFILFDGNKQTDDFKLADSGTLVSIGKEMTDAPFSHEVLLEKTPSFELPEYKSPFVKGHQGNFSIEVNGKPIYIRGVAYNTAHDWRDGNMPLTRRQVEKDMEKIKSMGANTIRRYDHGIYDKNILNIAGEYGINVLYGFWFDPKVDFYKDSAKVEEYIENVEEKVRQFKDHSSVIAWSVGNETWGLLKHSYAKPYLTKVRQSYINLMEQLAERIHIIDPTRPVFSCIEHEKYQLAGEIVAFHDGAPSLDAIGINSYYREQISTLNHVFTTFEPARPYLISEFGPRGYWDPHFNRTSRKLLVEDNEAEKAEWYKYQWKTYVHPYKGYNIGGIAYCWHDRMEGSNTWFGLTDYMGRPKLSYYALKESWTGEKTVALPEFKISVPSEIKPGKEYSFTANASSNTDRELEYVWAIHKDNILEKVDVITSSENTKEITLRIPEEPAEYRIYLYVSDELGNVSTASVPIKVY